ncbi:16S rRNA (cytosine(967)-C(5))-methyltransferase RsmB [Testudinibacter aquarius]|uniref:Ribosomal RNA small subunit methyltransferase B n=1 Tax=Testudinibacter aquarius TaxID=1524974 RepID=A0A4R3YCC7_9PAST|nr:16S rRNA (cytosine(967)-C(5))-methyltransferase RsmB [Testudinibacter aquarius]KAE9527536.1 16S rRNA (cytosine(967)-C(5))-methyltransferase [Testudinibacter aquarius]TCV89462.1 16S rRNA (cytosine967-C5)-methyltransferase [Testudinibacter aquarius]TNG88027.1 16S rRNA (cytosine(967)-C(5))-methyltransferase RsmB [Testudinibacter aquarius]
MKQIKKTLSVRAVAAQILLQVLDQGKSLSALLPDMANQVKPQDQPLLQEICFGVCRVLPRLERIIALLVQKPLKGKTRIVHCLLLVGLYQLLYMRIPPHAAVDEVVNAASALKNDSFRSLLNGVLRRFLREQAEILATVDKHWQTLHPEWLVNRLKQDYPQDWREIVEANNQKPPMWLRVNSQHCSTQDYLERLIQQGIQAEICPEQPACAIRLQSAVSVNQLPHFEQGWVTVQDSHAQWAGLLLQPQNHELILDACAAPGGKTTHILELAPLAQVIALDVEAHRLQRVEQNLQRLNQQAEVICGDASQPQQWLADGVMFDRILLDAPCSATGVIRRHPDIKWLRREQDIEALSALQQQILTALWARLKVGGTLLYATCSVLKQENQQQIDHFLAQHCDAKLEAIFGQSSVMQFFPQQQGGDGFFYAKLIKRA